MIEELRRLEEGVDDQSWWMQWFSSTASSVITKLTDGLEANCTKYVTQIRYLHFFSFLNTQ